MALLVLTTLMLRPAQTPQALNQGPTHGRSLLAVTAVLPTPAPLSSLQIRPREFGLVNVLYRIRLSKSRSASLDLDVLC